jgi:cell division initiation protein
MLTPYDIEVKKFEKKMRGYGTAEVDELMQAVLTDYEKLYKENAALKGKMTVLVEKIEEYQKVEESLRNAVVSAQKLGETMIKDATQKRADVRGPNIKVRAYHSNINNADIPEKQRLEDANGETICRQQADLHVSGNNSLHEAI